MKTYVVNLLKDKAKRAEIERQLANHPELEYQIWNAVEGKKLTEQEQKEMILPEFFNRYGRDATLPAVGCSLSHYYIYKDIVATNSKYALVLEDDAILSPNLKVDDFLSLLDSNEPIAILLTSDFMYFKSDIIKQIDKTHKIFKVDYGYMTSGYLINNKAAYLLSENIFPIRYTADAWKEFIDMGIVLYGVVPHLISFPDGLGEIGQASNHTKGLIGRIKATIISIYIKLIHLNSCLKGEKWSSKKWR